MDSEKQLLENKNFILQLDECSISKYTNIFLIGIIVIIILSFYYYHYRSKQPSQNKSTNKKLILIGQSGVGKTKIFNIASENKIQRKENQNQTSSLYEFNIGNNLEIVDTPSIEFETSHYLREEIIEKFTRYFKENFNLIQKFYIVVNFERTDIMKNKILKTLKYFKKFKFMINIIVTQFQLSEDDVKDQQNLKEGFSHFVDNPQNIYFIRDDIQCEELKQLFIETAGVLDYKDTIFEDVDGDEIQQNAENLKQMILDGKQYLSVQAQQ
ncbi:unnamed protein product [Paramecium sonneborni]|uniref:G domain-containing protein n=1 Tax=Paramecium sonneborni TaxID=65129 RepID=A0A8S1P5P2_9CILI|nr:unnamed protein product [Paramecium sonneborni]